MQKIRLVRLHCFSSEITVHGLTDCRKNKFFAVFTVPCPRKFNEAKILRANFFPNSKSSEIRTVVSQLCFFLVRKMYYSETWVYNRITWDHKKLSFMTGFHYTQVFFFFSNWKLEYPICSYSRVLFYNRLLTSDRAYAVCLLNHCYSWELNLFNSIPLVWNISLKIGKYMYFQFYIFFLNVEKKFSIVDRLKVLEGAFFWFRCHVRLVPFYPGFPNTDSLELPPGPKDVFLYGRFPPNPELIKDTFLRIKDSQCLIGLRPVRSLLLSRV